MTKQTRMLKVFMSFSGKATKLAEEIKQHVESLGHGVLGYDIPSATSVVTSAQSAIADADAAIVILEPSTPNVYFEAGTAVGRGKQILLVGGHSSDIPVGLMGFQRVLTATSPTWWRDPISAFLSSVMAEPQRATRKELDDFRELLEDPSLLTSMREHELLMLVDSILRAHGATVEHEHGARSRYASSRIDLVARHATGGLQAVICKTRPIGARLSVDAVQQLEYATSQLDPSARGLLVTTGRFTDAARHYAEHADDVKIDLWDGNRLLDELDTALKRQQRDAPT